MPSEETLAGLAARPAYTRADLARDRGLIRQGVAARDKRTSFSMGKNGKKTAEIPAGMFWNAVKTEGREVALPAADGYWKDQLTRTEEGRACNWDRDTNTSLRNMRCRHGRISERTVYVDGERIVIIGAV